MLNLYVAPSSASSRKAKRWLKKYNIPYKKRNIAHQPLTEDEIMKLLRLTTNGCSDLISTRSNAYKKLIKNKHVNLEDLPLPQFVSLMVKYPDLIRRPIMFTKHKIEIGYNCEEIRQFLPHSYRRKELRHKELELDQLDQRLVAHP